MRLALVVCLLCLFAVLPGLAEESDFPALLRRSLLANPELKQGQAALARRRAELPAAGALPDPMLETGLQNFEFARWSLGSEPMSNLAVMVSQELPYPPKLALRTQMAEIEVAMARQELRMRVWRLYRDLKSAYSELSYTHQAEGLLNELERLLRQMLKIVELNYSVGKAMQADVLSVRQELSMLNERKIMLEQRRSRARIVIERVLGDIRLPELERTGWQALPEPGPLPDLNRLVQALLQAPELQEAAMVIRLSEFSEQMAQLEFIPDPMLSGGVMLRGPLPAMWNLQVGFPLPVFAARKQAPLAEAAVEARKEAKARAENLRQRLVAQVRDNLTMIESELKQAELYREVLIPQARLTVDALLAGYVGGKIDFVDLLEGYRQFLEYHLTLPEKQLNAQRALAMLEEMLATSLSFRDLDKEIEP
ncbi:MAG: TolC family protein [Candidatus Sericytochromatia bacterium]